MRKHVLPEEHRVISKKKKLVIVFVFLLAAAAVIWYKIPYNAQYTGTLMWDGEGADPPYGTVIDVEIDVRVQRYFFAEPLHMGTVTVGDAVFTNDIGKFVPTPSLSGAFCDKNTFLMVCSEWQGNYLVNRCLADVEFGRITYLQLKDAHGTAVGTYRPLPKGSE